MCGKKSFWALTQLQQEQSRVKKDFFFISDISYVSYNIRLTQKGQLATFLYSRLAHKEATGNNAHFLEYKPHLTNIHEKLLVLQKNRCMRKELKSSDLSLRVKSSDQTLVVRPTEHLVNSFHIPPLF
jgi:hypothetical protein